MRKNLPYKILISILAISLIILGFEISSEKNKIEVYENNEKQQSSLLSGEDSVQGYSCGVLNTKKAKEIINSSNVDKKYSQGPAVRIRQDLAPEKNIFWTDSCRYQDSTNSNKYVEMYVATFNSEEAAEAAFPNFLRLVNDAEKIPNQTYGQELVYDGGVFYLLKENRVIQISANNGGTQDIDLFSREVLAAIFNNL